MKKLSIAVLMTAMMLSGCNTVGGLTDNVATLVGYDTNTLNTKANTQYQQLIAASTVDTTSATAKAVHRVFNRLVPYADAMNHTGVKFSWQMTVIRDKTENAWAMPGGKMAFYTGLAERYNLTDGEIAAVVGHEMAHALLEHSKKQMGGQVLSGLAMQIGAAAVQAKTGYNADMVNLGAGILNEYGLDKPYSRQHEYEADALGMRIMAQAGYNPADAINVWNKMNAVNPNGNSKLGNILSTHPNNNNRITAMQKLLPENQAIYEAARRR